MPKITPLSGKKMFKILKIFGFECIRVHGSHHFMRNIYGRTTVIPIHSNELL
ncbi:type II toxin-antitoxin system HicA family toxin [Patescibacteria group bacterium]|nr:type II toxin-antitoxin system HicA family toxin [Patescibacteria group bacterium]